MTADGALKAFRWGAPGRAGHKAHSRWVSHCLDGAVRSSCLTDRAAVTAERKRSRRLLL